MEHMGADPGGDFPTQTSENKSETDSTAKKQFDLKKKLYGLSIPKLDLDLSLFQIRIRIRPIPLILIRRPAFLVVPW